MFWWKKEVTVSGNVAVEEHKEVLANVAPTKTAVELDMTSEDLAEYVEVAKSLGLENQPAILDERLARFLVEENIHAYDDDSVAAYLDKEFGVGGWEWRGLRERDVKYLKGWTSHIGGRNVRFSDRLYSDAIPLPVLLTVKKISEKFPSVYFYISNSKAKDGDPFLYVTTREMTGYIVERWNEPGFRETTQP